MTTSPQPRPRARRRAILAPALVGSLTLLSVAACDLGQGSASGSVTPSTPIAATATPDPFPTVTVGPPTPRRASATSRPAQASSAKGLDPQLRDALAEAAADARRDGVSLHVNSGKRTAAQQQQLLDEAVEEYGSEEEARGWVATPETSPHVSGDAVDIGPAESATWLERNGAAYGLCRIYRNEPWHFELRAEAPTNGCPTMYADPTEDPRTQR